MRLKARVKIFKKKAIKSLFGKEKGDYICTPLSKAFAM
jgi:hypothetical protein